MRVVMVLRGNGNAEAEWSRARQTVCGEVGSGEVGKGRRDTLARGEGAGVVLGRSVVLSGEVERVLDGGSCHVWAWRGVCGGGGVVGDAGVVKAEGVEAA